MKGSSWLTILEWNIFPVVMPKILEILWWWLIGKKIIMTMKKKKVFAVLLLQHWLSLCKGIGLPENFRKANLYQRYGSQTKGSKQSTVCPLLHFIFAYNYILAFSYSSKHQLAKLVNISLKGNAVDWFGKRTSQTKPVCFNKRKQTAKKALMCLCPTSGPYHTPSRQFRFCHWW